MSAHPIIRQIIDRDCHVSMSPRQVVRHVISRLRDGYTTFRRLSRYDRRRLIEDCVRRHQENRRLYQCVMSGVPPKCRNRSTAPGERVLPPDRLSGGDICRLMRKHRVTIRALAAMTGISQKRIREVRHSGLHDPLAVRDWLQAITAVDPGPIPEKYRVGNPLEEAQCDFCGCPIFLGEFAYSYLSEVFCSRHCCRKSRSWS